LESCLVLPETPFQIANPCCERVHLLLNPSPSRQAPCKTEKKGGPHPMKEDPSTQTPASSDPCTPVA
jgi:hypothetical protein